jgi:hypothetical protein
MEALTEYAIQADSRAQMLDALVSVGRMKSAIAAFEASLVAGIANHVEQVEAPEFRDRVIRSEIAAALRVPEQTAGALIATSRALVDELPATMAALEAGTISWRHAERLADHAASLPVEAKAGFERALLPSAEMLNPGRFDRQARIVRERMHPETIATRRVDAVDQRRVGIDPGRDGMAWLTALLPAEQAEAIDNRLEDIARGLRTAEETRTLPQLRVDTFAEFLIDGDIPTSRGIVATVAVTIPMLTLLGRSDEPAELEGLGPIPADVARKLCADVPTLTRILTHPVTGTVLTLDRTRYRPSKRLAKWIRMRDGTCRFPGCGRKARTADIDHIIAWAEGGTTNPDNLECLCEAHHRLKHNSGWTPRSLGNGTIEWTSPSGRTSITRPQAGPGS